MFADRLFLYSLIRKNLNTQKVIIKYSLRYLKNESLFGFDFLDFFCGVIKLERIRNDDGKKKFWLRKFLSIK